MIAEAANALLGQTGEWVHAADGHSSTVVRRDGMVAKWHGLSDRAEREITAYQHISARVPDLLPELIAFDGQLMVLEDLGEGRSLVDALTTGDRTEALSHLRAWVDAVARLHEGTWFSDGESPDLSGHGLLFERGRTAAAENERVSRLDSWEAAQPEIDDLARLAGVDGPAIFTIGDMCPGNDVMTPDGIRLFDLEAAGHIHPALDLTYLHVPWPSCWCCWDLPAQVRADMTERYYAGISRRADVEAGMAAAMAYWGFLTAAFMMPSDDPEPDEPMRPDVQTPLRRSVFMTRLVRTLEHPGVRDEFPSVSRWLDDVRSVGRELFGEVAPLEVAPALQ